MYTHPATARRNELIRQGYTIIAEGQTLDAMRKNAKTYPEGTVWISTGDVMSPPDGEE